MVHFLVKKKCLIRFVKNKLFIYMMEDNDEQIRVFL
jgi:hypothetical protein